MGTIAENLQKIISAIYGREVRQAIHDSIEQCYTDMEEAKLNSGQLRSAIIHSNEIGERFISVNDSVESEPETLNVYGVSKQYSVPTAVEPAEINSVSDDRLYISGVNNIFPESFTADDMTAVYIGSSLRYGYVVQTTVDCYVYAQNQASKNIVRYPLNDDMSTASGNVVIATTAGVFTTAKLTAGMKYAIVAVQLDNPQSVADNLNTAKVCCTTDVNKADSRAVPDEYAVLVQSFNGITLRGIPVDSGGNVTVGNQQYISDWVDLKSGVIHRKIGVTSTLGKTFVAISSGSERYIMRHQFSPNLNVNYVSSLVATNAMSTRYVCKPSGNSGINGGKVGFAISSKYLWIYDDRYNTSSSAGDFNTWIADNPVEIIYELKNEITENVSDYGVTLAELPKMKKLDTIMTSSHGAVIECGYISDAKTYIDNKINELFAVVSSD